MNNIKLEIVDTKSNDSYHIKLLIDDEDCGYLYLSSEELDTLDKVFRYGQTQYDYKYKKGNDAEGYDYDQ